MSVKVCKFGGTAMADAKTIKRVKDIIESDLSRRFIIVSAPGKRYPNDEKVTDLLLECHKELIETGTCKKSFDAVRARFVEIVNQLELTLDVNSILDITFNRIEREKSEQFTASRGEYLCGIVISEYLHIPLVDAEEVIFFNGDGTIDANKTRNATTAALGKVGKAVIPGFYGTGKDGKVRTFSRGGSDITGALVANAVNASLYENWTDVSGFLACDPAMVDNPKTIETLSYRELRELSYMGAKVLHSESVFPVRKLNIPIQIKNTFNPAERGTSIVPVSQCVAKSGTVTGIAGKKNYTVIQIEKALINSETGFAYNVLSSIKAEQISVEHIVTGVDSISLVIDDSKLTKLRLNQLIEKIKNEVKPEIINVVENIALIAIVGQAVSASAEIIARLFKAIASAGISAKVIVMGINELNLTVGVNAEDYERCIKAIYGEFFKN